MVDSITGLLLYRNLPRRRDGGYRRYHRYTGTRQMRGYDRGGEESVRRSTGASKCGYGHRTGKSVPCSQGEEKADRRDGVGQISELEWNGNVCFRRIELYSDA